MLHLALYSLVPIFAGAGIHVIERRGRQEKINPGRQIELGTLLESMPEAVFLFDSGEKVLDVNAAAEQLCGADRTTSLSLNASELAKRFGADGGEIDFPEGAVRHALHGETIRQLRRGFRHPSDGHTIEALISASPLRGPGGEIVGALLIVRDITEMAQLQRHLADTQKHYAVGQMAASIAHDFNNVLEAIHQAVYILQTSGDGSPEERKSTLALIEKAVHRGAEISQRVSQYLKGGSGGTSNIALKGVLDDSIELTRPLWSKVPNLTVTWKIDEMPAVCGNASDLRRVFTNLIINALEAMPKGGCLDIRATLRGRVTRIDISDTGQGIKPEHRNRIFSQYFTTKREGTGLGLSSAQRTITALHGKLTFKSEVGKGTTFCIELPVAEQSRAVPGDVEKNSSQANRPRHFKR